MDFAFGTLSTDALKLYRRQLLHQGVRHDYHITPKRPLAHEPITLFVTTGVDTTADSIACYFTTDGTEPVGARGTAVNGDVLPLERVETVWDNFAWGYTTRWATTLPGFSRGVRLRYRLGAWADDQPEIFADYPDLKLSEETAAHRHFNLNLPPDPALSWGQPQPGTVFALTIEQPGPPAWAREAIIYHLMIDRFHPGNGRGWRQTSDLEDFCGGTLQGVYKKLDYIAALGINTIWLSPLWASPSAHGYDTTDFRQIQPRYGDVETLRRLIGAAHDRGLRVLFDMACNHISDAHPLFQKALADSTSPYRHWFTFDDSAVGYRSFFGVATMPEINMAHPDARDWMVENALYWLREFDIDGYRLDYASGPRPDFWSYLVGAAKQEKPGAFFFGEIVDAPDVLRTYVGRLDGTLDFHANHALRQTYGWQKWTEADYGRFLRRHRRYFPDDFIMPAFLDNHDMDRFSYIVDGDRQAVVNGLAALLALPNPPIIYYGTEIGVPQTLSTRKATLAVSRVPMRWGDNQDRALLDQTRALIRQRQETRP